MARITSKDKVKVGDKIYYLAHGDSRFSYPARVICTDLKGWPNGVVIAYDLRDKEQITVIDLPTKENPSRVFGCVYDSDPNAPPVYNYRAIYSDGTLGMWYGTREEVLKIKHTDTVKRIGIIKAEVNNDNRWSDQRNNGTVEAL